MLSLEQVTAFGLTPNPIRRLVRSGQWRRPSEGLIYVRPDPPPWLALAWGGVLLGGDRARLGGRAAAHVHGLIDAPPDQIEVCVPWERVMTSRWPWAFRRERPGVRLASYQSPPRVAIDDTIVDLCLGASEEEVITLVTQAIQLRLTSVSALRRRIHQRSRVSHRKLLLTLVSDVAEGAESPLELRYLRRVERAHSLPTGRRQASNRASHVRDVRYDRFRTVVELDGRLGHEQLGRFRDMRRDNFATVSQEATLRYGRADVWGRPCEVAQQVASVLVDRGWEGLPSRCPDCQNVPEFGWA